MSDSKNEKIKSTNLYFHPDGKFISGGLADEKEYEFLGVKTMLLLKEVNDPQSNYDWSLPKLFESIGNHETPFYRTWKNVCRWLLAVNDSNIYFEDINDELLLRALKWIATTNLKKSAGEMLANYDEIIEHARMYQSEWMEEISIVNPDLIVCAGTFDIVKTVLSELNLKYETCKSGAEYFKWNNKIYLEFVHPAYRVSDKMMFSYFKETVNELRGLLHSPANENMGCYEPNLY